jgi:7,8-dihydropterin-6-yl-methyl-4-(beta-D-ribofuranosyl)aminobenzene 5'-phosphate synthase
MKKTVCVLLNIFLLFVVFTNITAQEQGEIKITILYDNTVAVEGTQADWGFSCIIEGSEKCILFDAGTRPTILMHNIEKLHIDPQKAEFVIITHNHRDHYGGLYRYLEENRNVTVYLAKSFHDQHVARIKKLGAQTVAVDKPVEICKDIYLTGEMGMGIKEQAIVLDTEKGIVVLTGCAHPGIVGIVKKAKEILDIEIYLVLGGFHLLWHSNSAMEKIIEDFRELGVQKVGATHCTGEKQIDMFRKAYGEDFVEMGVGRAITLRKKSNE